MNSSTRIVLYWLVASLFLVCLVPFNFRPDFVLPLGGARIPLHHILFLGGGAALLGWCLWDLLRVQEETPLFLWLCGALALTLIVSSVCSPFDKKEAVRVSLGIIFRCLTPALTAYVLVKFHEDQDKLINMFFVLGGVIAMGSLYELWTGRFFLFNRDFTGIAPMDAILPSIGFAVGPTGHPLWLSVLLNLFLPLAIYKTVSFRRQFLFLVPLLVFGIIVMTLRRSGWLSLVMIITMMVFGVNKHRIKMLAVLVVMLAGIGFLLITKAFKSNILERFSFYSVRLELRDGNRAQALKTAFNIFKEDPIVGVGPGQYPKAHMQVKPDQILFTMPDNQYLRFLAEGGILVFSTFMAFWGFVLVTLIKNRQDKWVWTFLATFLVFSFNIALMDGLLIPPIQMVAGAIIGLAMGTAESHKSKDI